MNTTSNRATIPVGVNEVKNNKKYAGGLNNNRKINIICQRFYITVGNMYYNPTVYQCNRRQIIYCRRLTVIISTFFLPKYFVRDIYHENI